MSHLKPLHLIFTFCMDENGNADKGCRVLRKPTWGTCAGLILLAEAANQTKKGGQELIGGLDVRVNRNHFGRQTESFQADLDLPFLNPSSSSSPEGENKPFRAIFIRAPVVEKLLPHVSGIQLEEASREETVIAPSRAIDSRVAAKIKIEDVEILGTLPARGEKEAGDIIAVKQGNCFGTSFHPELTGDERIHVWWLEQVAEAVERRRGL